MEYPNMMSTIRRLKKQLAVLVLATLAFGGYAHAQTGHSPRDMFLESVSPLKFDETVAALKAEIAANGWMLVAAHDLSAAVAKSGQTILPVTIIEACSGKFSVPLLKNDQTRYISSLLPCRVSVYQTHDGKVIISRMNIPAMSQQMEPIVSDVMLKANDSFEPVIAKILAQAKAQ
jgi:uncharacterized protein (DUF302 family)